MKAWISLQNAMNGLVDNIKENILIIYGKQTIKQILKKKEGLFYKYLMISKLLLLLLLLLF